MKNRSTLFLIFICLVITIACNENKPQTETEAIPNTGFIQVKGGNIWYNILGNGDKTPLLMLHGGPGGKHRYFYPLTPQSEERPIILFDQLGSGRSDHHEDSTLLTVDQFVEQVRAVKEALELDTFYLLGHSWGSALALEYYQKYPDGIGALIFSSPYFSTRIWSADADTLIRLLPDSIQNIIANAERTGKFDSDDYKAANDFYWATFGERSEYPRHPLDTVDAQSNKFIYNYMWGPSEFTATGILEDYDNHKSLKSINVPTLFLTGEFDEARPETVGKFQMMVSGAQFSVIPNSGHSTMTDNPKAYNRALGNFLQTIEK